MSKINGRQYGWGEAGASLAIEAAFKQSATTLDLSSMGLQSLPKELWGLTYLKTLNIWDNELSDLPPQIGQLRQLQVLAASYNKLSSLPADIGELIHLQILDVRGNILNSLPTSICQLGQLRTLSINDNKLSNLPIEIGKLEQLQRLFIRNNNLSSLPNALQKIKTLKEVSLSGNPLPIPSEHLRSWDKITDDNQSGRALLDYYFIARHQPIQPIRDARVLILGEANVGKSAIVRQLIDKEWLDKRVPTEGISIEAMKIEGSEYTLHIWDFGGQIIMHATHTLFLAARALYLLVLDASQDESKNGLYTWLRLIRLYAPDAPIIVVINKSDLKTLPLDEKGLMERYRVAAFVSVSCATGVGVNDLYSAMRAQLTNVPHIHDLIAESWQAVREQLKAHDKSYLTVGAFSTLCHQEDIPQEQIDSVADYFDALGIALRYQDSAKRTTHILNPNWVIEAIYPLINDEVLKAAGGVMSKEDIARRLDDTYDAWEQHLILDRMVEAEVAFVLDNHTYVLPSLLHKERPSFTWNNHTALHFIYEYDVIPPSLFNRFVGRHKHEIHRDKLMQTLWRSGVLLHRQGKPYALVIIDSEAKRVEVRVRPVARNDARPLLDDIRNTFDALHREFAGIEVKEMVPLPRSQPLQYIDYQRLLRLEARDVEFYPGDDEDYSVNELLDGIANSNSRRRRAEHQQEREQPAFVEQNSQSTLVAFFAKPFNLPELAQRGEYRHIHNVLPSDRFRVYAPFTATATDLQNTLRDESPQIVYFSGHGTKEGLVIETKDGGEQIVKWHLIAELLKRFAETITGVVFNCCHAEHILPHLPIPPFTLITQQGDLPDERVAVVYMQTLFEWLKSGESLTEAHEASCWHLKGIYDGDLPILTAKKTSKFQE